MHAAGWVDVIRARGRGRIGGARGTVNLSGTVAIPMISWARRWRRRAVRWAGAGADLLFPPSCRWCRCESHLEGGDLCSRCAREFRHDQARCQRCGAAAAEVSPRAGCSACGRRRPQWEGIAILGGYADPLREAILRIKRPGAEDLAAALARLLVEKHRPFFERAGIDAVVPVPMHWWRRWSRGTSSAEDIARPLAWAIGRDVRAVIVRTRATRMQNELPAEERGGNVAGAFRVRSSVAGRRVLVVDDVVTTGATLAACCRILREAGAAAVFGAALAMADRTADAWRTEVPA